ncbi:MAG: hypothetical protein PHX92_02605 [Candidatus Pacebacteria bacterium]|nr:hypothetical protein [Candidatus Paceibacterota bacterium]
MNKLSSETIKDINKFRSLFPKEISVLVRRGDNDRYCAEITTYEGCFTEGNTFAELTEMINDAVRTYLDIPEEYFQYMPEYFPAISSIKQFGVFPPMNKEIKADFNIFRENEKACC